ncbi:MAG TPA: hypothetical protein VHY84_24510 [Bryobacteraceae bacterium]|jgi:hypothetical protein|nr:hypothetical protein [Bryobacteraceae bacterium]
MRARALFCSGLSLLAVFGIGRMPANMDENRWVPIDDPAIQYDDRPLDDPVTRLSKQMEAGKAKLEYAPNGLGYLPSLLKNLGINIDSQLLVFSKTSFQQPKIAPWSPRAVFFTDNVAVGSVQGGDVLELAALDPKQGVNFYTLDVKRTAKPSFDRRSDCLQCHQGITTLGIPGIMVTSVFPSGDGTPAFRGAAMETDHRTPFGERWGGWYVTGLTGSERHMGNAVAHDSSQPRNLDMAGTQNLTSLGRRFDSSNYLAKTSDIVALMTLEHQTRMTNLMIRTAWDTRVGLSKGELVTTAKERIDGDIDALVTYMLFADEAKIYEPIQGVSTFTTTFPERGPRDKQGRSLRDFDLHTRMFRYPLSYMIYSETFDAMPDLVREKIYRRLYDVLTGKDQSKTFARLSEADRRAIFEILLETKRGLPDYWKAEPVTTAEAH